MNSRHASKNIKKKSGVKRIRRLKVDENGEVIQQFITQIKEKFECIDKKFDMIQERLDLQLTEFQANRKTFRRLTE